MKKDALKQVNKRNRPRVSEDGKVTFVPIALYLDPRGEPQFVLHLPEYISNALGCGRQVSAPTADRCDSEYSARCNQYAQWKKNANAVLVIVIEMGYECVDGERHVNTGVSSFRHRDDFDVSRALCLSYKLAYRIGDKLHCRKEQYDPKTKMYSYKPTYALNTSDDELIFDHTDELQAQVDAILATINRAGLALKSLAESKNPLALLLGAQRGALSFKGQP